jgi:malate synthase
MKSYSELVIYTCHRRGIHAMGGMAAQIPIKNDENSNNVAMSRVKEDKVREVLSGHDGTWVAHPGLISIVRDIFDRYMPDRNQIDKIIENNCTRYDLLESPTGEVTELGLRKNINVGILYIEAWLSGNGCVPLYNLMEDAATAEISRTQVWQWINHERFSIDEFKEILNDEINKIKHSLGENKFKEGKYDIASQLFEKLSTSSDLVNFLTLPAYKLL